MRRAPTHMFASAVIACSILATACEKGTAPDPFVAIGSWGGEHALLAVTSSGATIEFDCAHGTLPAPIPLNGGTFDVAGDYVQEHGGPIRSDELIVHQPARYRGTVEKQSMTLRVTLTESGQDIGPYSLTYAAFARVFKCL